MLPIIFIISIEVTHVCLLCARLPWWLKRKVTLSTVSRTTAPGRRPEEDGLEGREVTWVSIEVMWTRSCYSLKIFDYIQSLLRTNAWSLERPYVLTVPL